MSNRVAKIGRTAEVKSLSERMGLLEDQFAQVLLAIDERFRELGQLVAKVNEFQAALIDLQGRAEVVELVNQRRVERARAESVKEKAALEAGIEAGYVVTADQIGPRSLVVGRYLEADGEVQEPGRVQLAIPILQGPRAPFQAALLGRAVGDKVEAPTEGAGLSFEILGVFGVDDDKYKEWALRQQAERTAAAAALAQQASGETDAPAAE